MGRRRGETFYEEQSREAIVAVMLQRLVLDH